MTPESTSRVDLHCHSTASAVSKLGVQRALGLPECATPPEEVYELAKRRGMDFVTITDHDTIDGALELAARYDDAFVSEELTASFRGEAQAVHILCWGITPDDHERLRALSGDVEAVANELRERSIACALAHPFYAVEAPLLPRHRRRLAQLFPTWETRNGSRARELNAPAVVYIETHGGTGVGGSDDHAGVDIGRTFTQTPAAPDWRTFLNHVVLGQATARGEQGSAAKWTHAAMGLATRALGRGASDGAGPNPAAVFDMVQRLMREGDARTGALGTGLCPDDARALLRAWLSSIELDLNESELLALPAGRRLQPRRPLPPRPARARAQARAGGRADRDGRAERRRRRRLRGDAVRGLPRRDPVRAGRGVPRPREGEARAPRRRAAARRARRRRRRRHARRHAHARRAARARRARLRGRGRRHRRQRRPPPQRGRRDRHPVLRGPAGRRAEPARDRRDARRGPL